VHGLDKALRQGQSHLGWIVVCCGLTGICLAQLMMWWMNAVDYTIWVSGKEPYAWPSTIPITFELMVLLSGFCAVFGMFGAQQAAAPAPPDLPARDLLARDRRPLLPRRSRRPTRSSTARRRRASSRASAASTSRSWRTDR
jgi:hypothetical protein